MIETIRELNKRMRARSRRNEVEYDEEGRAIIGMTVRSDEGFLSDFSIGRKPVVGEGVAAFLEECAMAFSPKEAICIKIYSDCIDKKERELYSVALREYYVRHYDEKRREIRQKTLFSAIFFCVGFLALCSMILFSFLQRYPVLSEVLDIFAWVFLWESVDLFFLQRKMLLAERSRYLRFTDAKLLFFPLSQRESE